MHFRRLLMVCVLLAVPAGGSAQSLLERPPLLSGDWTGAPGTIYFHFLHRFSVSDKPERKVSNVPTFLLAAGLPARLLAGFNYSTNSILAPRFPNEWELFGRWLPLSQDYGAPLDLGGQVGYNNASDGVDAELSVAKRFGNARLLAAGRALADPFEEGNVRVALAGGAVIRLGQYVALAGDIATLTGRDSTEKAAWSAGLHVAIPLTPHTVSLQVTNALVGTLQGASRGTDDVRFGFEFTVPLTLRRYFGGREEPQVATVAPPPDSVDAAAGEPPAAALDTAASEPAVTAPPAPAVTPRPEPARPDTPRARTDSARAPARAAPVRAAPARRPASPSVSIGIKNLNYLKTRIEVSAGTTVVWTNNDPVAHTVTATDKSFDSGTIAPGKTYRRTFTKPGTYNYFCVPHPFMKGVVIVK